MDKNQLLEKFKNENKDGDERSLYLKEKCYSVTFKIVLITLFWLQIVEYFMDINIPLECGVVFLFLVAVYSFFSFIWLKKSYSLLFAIFGFIGIIGYYYHILTGTYLL